MKIHKFHGCIPALPFSIRSKSFKSATLAAIMLAASSPAYSLNPLFGGRLDASMYSSDSLLPTT